MICGGCDLSLPEALPETVYLYWDLEQNEGIPSPIEYEVTQKSDFQKQITNLLERNRRGWTPSVVSYAPYIKIVSANRIYTLNITPELLIVNYKKNASDTRAMQMVKKTPNGIFDLFLEIVRSEKYLKKKNPNQNLHSITASGGSERG